MSLVSPDGSSLIYSSYYGGSGTDSNFGSQPTLGTDGFLYVAGTTNSPDLPTTTGALHSEHSGNDDVLLLVVRVPSPGS